jgi:hypothetical protein
MALHPGSLSAAYAALQEHGWAARTMRHACERAAYSGSFTQGRVTVTFDREAGYQVTTRPLPELPAEPEGPQADVYLARAVKRGWHMDGVGTITSVFTHTYGGATFTGPQGHRTAGLDWLVEATPPAAQDQPAS